MLRARLGRPAISAILDSARAARPRFKRGRKNLRGWVEKVQVACEFKAHGAVPSGKAEVCKGLLPFSFCAPRRRKYSVGVRLVVGRVSAPVIGPAGGLRAGSHWFTTSPKTALEMSSRKSRGWRFPIRVHARPLRNVTNAARSSSGWYSWKPRSASSCARCRRMVLLSVVRKARHPDLYALSRWRASPSVFSPMSPGWGHDLLLVFKPEYLADLLKLVGPDHVADRDRHIQVTHVESHVTTDGVASCTPAGLRPSYGNSTSWIFP